MYSWTGENRLRRMETRTDLPAAVPRINLEFKYDQMGRCIKMEVKDGATVLETRYYVWNGWQRNWELDESSGFTKAFEWGPDVSHAQDGAGTRGGLPHHERLL